MFSRITQSSSLVLALLMAVLAQAQTAENRQASKTSIIIERQLVRFITQGEALEWHLVVTNQQEEIVFDSGFVYGSTLEWSLKNRQDEALQSGLYAYTLTTKAAADEAPHTQRGHLIVDRASSSDRVWLTSTQPVGIGAGSEAPQVTVIGSREATLGGAELPGAVPRREASAERSDLPQRSNDEAAAEKTAGPAVVNGTANRVAKFDFNGTSLVDSTISEVGGNVGIGTTTPQAGFDYRGGSAAFYTRDIGTGSTSTAQSALQLGLANLASRNVGVGPSMLFFGENTAGAKSFLGRVSGVWENPTAGAEAGAIFFQVRANNGDVNALTERMRITAAGNVGIGATNPATRLHVVGDRIRLENGGKVLDLRADGSSADIQTLTGSLFLRSRPGHVIINPDPQQGDGNVGIGTNSPAAKLHLSGPNSRLRLDSSQSNLWTVTEYKTDAREWHTGVGGSNVNNDLNNKYYIGDFTAFQVRMVIDTNGRVGIGTTGPTAKLHVVTSGEDNAVAGKNATWNTFGALGDMKDGVFGGSNYPCMPTNPACPPQGAGVHGFTDGGVAIWGQDASSYNGKARGWAGYFDGEVFISQDLFVNGELRHFSSAASKIDHPLDPANKYLSQAIVESPDRMNIYNGNVITNENGEAEVRLPDYVAALNRDFRYQLTVIGQFAQAIVARKIQGNNFMIKTSLPNVEVSWQVTGTRQDAYAKAHRIQVEEQKPEKERSYFLHPEVHGQPPERGVEWARQPELMRQMKEQREKAQLGQPQQERP